MILTRTPFRASFMGGGSDLPAFYEKYGPGRVITAAIGAFMYVTISQSWLEKGWRIAYSTTENVSEIDDIKHELIREAIRLMQPPDTLEIHTTAMIPGRGTGLGSSAAVTVGVLRGLHAYINRRGDVPAEFLAQLACQIEIDILGKSCGKQDQYAVALGGVQDITFHPDGSVTADRVYIPKTVENWIRFFYTGKARAAEAILVRQAKAYHGDDEAIDLTLDMVDAVPLMRSYLEEGNMAMVGSALDAAYRDKKRIARLNDLDIDSMYEKALDAGALGGKLLGAGGGGFLMLVVPPDDSARIERAIGRAGLRFPIGVNGTVVLDHDLWPPMPAGRNGL